MGANAITSLVKIVNSDTPTGDQFTFGLGGIPVFATTVTRDAAFGGANEKVLAQGQLCYLESTNAVQKYNGSAWETVGAALITKVERYTASGTFTPPADCVYAVAHIRGAGGSNGHSGAANGGASSVAFAAGTITANGGTLINGTFSSATPLVVAGTTNSGLGARGSIYRDSVDYNLFWSWQAGDGALIVAGGVVTPSVGITVTVGAGGAAGSGGAAGGSGYVWIQYQVPA